MERPPAGVGRPPPIPAPGPRIGPASGPLPLKPLQKRQRASLASPSTLEPLSPTPRRSAPELRSAADECTTGVEEALDTRLKRFQAPEVLNYTAGGSSASTCQATPVVKQEVRKLAFSREPPAPLAVEEALTSTPRRRCWSKPALLVPVNEWKAAAANVLEQRSQQRQHKEVNLFLQLSDTAKGPAGMKETPPRPRRRKALPVEEIEEFKPPKRPLSHYEESCLGQKLLPKFLARVKEAISGPVFDLCSSGIGDDQLAALLGDEKLVPTQQIQRWKLRDARMSDRGAKMLADVLTQDVEGLDLASNEIGLSGASSLGRAMLLGSFRRLRRVDLSANNLSDGSAAQLLGGLMVCPSLLRLDLRNNAIQDGSQPGLLVSGHSQLMRISLRRNQLSGAAIAALFEGILENTRSGGQLADVDIAWNSIASDSLLAAKAIAAVFRESATLYHCDLSYCSMDATSCAALGEGLRDNHSLYGLHIVGNAATMDADGFLMPLDEAGLASVKVDDEQTGLPGLLFGGVRPGPRALVGACRDRVAFSADDDICGRDALEQKTPCWACEGWVRQEIEWPYDPEDEPRAVWAFTSLDSFRRGLRLHRDEGSDRPRFVAARMVPPSPYRLQVVFQVDSRLQLLSTREREQLQLPVKIRLRSCEELPDLRPDPDQLVCQPSQGSSVPVAQTSEVNIITRSGKDSLSSVAAMRRTSWRSVVMDGPDGSVLMPRTTETEFQAKAKVVRGPPYWSSWKRETPSALRQALEVDWGRCRLGHMIGESEMEEVKKVLEPHYGWLTALYRRVSGMDVSGETGFGISQLQACDLMTTSGICDGVTTKVADIDRFFIAAKVTPPELKKKLVVVNDKTLVRYEFLEFILRIANHHYLNSGAANSMVEAASLMVNALEAEGKRQESEMRDYFNSIRNEAVDDVFKKHADVVAAAYKRFSGSKTPPGKPKYMALSEFQALLDSAEAYDAGFQQRHSSSAFRRGMMFQIDESGSSRFQEMTFLEFQHALCAAVHFSLGGPSPRLAPLLEELCGEKLPAALKDKGAKKS